MSDWRGMGRILSVEGTQALVSLGDASAHGPEHLNYPGGECEAVPRRGGGREAPGAAGPGALGRR